MPWLFLIISAVCEAFYNVFLKRASGFGDFKNIFIALLFVAGSILCFKKAITNIQLSIAMMAWSGVAISATIILDMIIYKTRFDLKISFFMLLCLISIIGLNYFSEK